MNGYIFNLSTGLLAPGLPGNCPRVLSDIKLSPGPEWQFTPATADYRRFRSFTAVASDRYFHPKACCFSTKSPILCHGSSTRPAGMSTYRGFLPLMTLTMMFFLSRCKLKLQQKTMSLWSWVNRPSELSKFTNPLFEANNLVIWPSVAPQSLQLWEGNSSTVCRDSHTPSCALCWPVSHATVVGIWRWPAGNPQTFLCMGVTVFSVWAWQLINRDTLTGVGR